MEAAVEKRWSVTVSDLQAWIIYIYIHFLFSSFFAHYEFFGGATCGVSVWNGGLTESTASVHYLHRVLDYEEEM